MTEFDRILSQYRSSALAQRGKGSYFEKLIRRYLLAEPVYKNRIETVWLWTDFPYRADFGGKDTGIDLVARTFSGEYWAVQCKLYAENAYISMPDVSTFLAASGKSFNAEDGKKTFSERLFVSTTNKWNSQAEMAIQNQNPPVTRISLSMLQNSCEYLDWQALDSGTSQPHSKYGGVDRLGISGSGSVMEETAGSFTGIKAAKAKKTLRPHQQDAVSAVLQHFEQADRAKLIMACGTGKTFTSLKIAEKLTDNSGLVLFLVPSIALLGQTLREWCSNSEKEIFPICVCSDSTVGRNGKKTDNDDISIVNLPMPASTNTDSIYRELKQSYNTRDRHGMTVVFSTYQSIDVVMQAQKAINSKNPGSFDFDIIICDEAHRTTGVILSNKEESSFTKAHDNNNIRAKKRLYMTATPRIYAESAKQKVKDTDCLLCSMDDEAIYGKEAYRIGFGAAVNQNLLADYKVLVLTVKEEEIPAIMRHSLPGSGDKEIPADDASRLIGCINALSKRVLEADKTFNDDPSPMRRAVAFCPKIADSKYITELFNVSAKDYYRTLPGEEREKLVDIESKHIDGAMGAAQRDLLLDWLKGDGGQSDGNSQCRILTNVRCLSEGVDVPSLDAVMFLSAKNSQIDVVQSVGRVMRTAPGKKYGYIIIPIMIPQGIKPEDALDDNKNYAVVWTVLNALRAHDDRFDAEINKIELNKNKGGRINVIGVSDGNNGEYGGGNDGESPVQINLPYDMDELKNVIYAKMVQKVGNKRYWVQWAEDVAHIAERYIAKINSLIAQPGRHQTEFNRFLKGLRRNINPSVRQEDAVQMLAQHLITRPVFEALFSNYSFAENNAVSKSLQKIINLLEEKSLQSDKETLSRFYQSVRERAEGIDNAEGRQKIITELYDKFFRTAFPKTTEKLGIVYTPIEVVDFICSSVAEVLKKEFGRTISDENVHILDPFTGTGTFIVRLIQTGLINPQALGRKYESELHANEIVLLAYYIASVNIENTYHSVMGEDKAYKPFGGICLTDTFQLGEGGDQFDECLPKNSERVKRQKNLPVRVIIGNPPYSVGQKSANDNAQNQKYEHLDARIADTYAAGTDAVNKNSLYDSYIKAFRWSSDRLDNEKGGIIAFVSNGQWLDNNSFTGFRKCLEKEFSGIYVFNLRGNQRTQGELSRKEGGKVFGSGSRTPIAITVLVKNPKKAAEITINENGTKNYAYKAEIQYYQVPDYLSREEKLALCSKYGSIFSLPFKQIMPDSHGDWISQRNEIFESFIPLEPDKKFNKGSKSTFSLYSLGMGTSRDAWVYNFSEEELKKNVQKTIDFYNSQVDDFIEEKKKNPKVKAESIISYKASSISWSSSLIPQVERKYKIMYEKNAFADALYRPFCKQKLYIGEKLIHRRGNWDQISPNSHKNLVIIISSNKDGCPIITDCITDIHSNGDSQCFPLYYYTKEENYQNELFGGNNGGGYVRHDGITDFILQECRIKYGPKTTKEDIFYYVYGLLHSPEYRQKFSADLKKMLPRIPLVSDPCDFGEFAQAGRELAILHINYEKAPAWPGVKVCGAESGNFRIDKMRFGKKDGQPDKTVLHYNSHIAIENIPPECYEYIINGRSPIEWIIDRYQVKTDKDSGIVNDPNLWLQEHNDPQYVLRLILSAITVSMETIKIIKALPKLSNA